MMMPLTTSTTLNYWSLLAALWSLAAMMVPSFSNAFTVIPTTTSTTWHRPLLLVHGSPSEEVHGSPSEEDDGEVEVKEPTVLVNGQELSTDETALDAKNPIFGATAAMAIAIETPIETTIQNVQQAGLMGLSLLNAKGESYETAEDIAPLVQGHRVGLYFGAGWCPACRDLEFMLPQYMDALCESGQKIRLIYVSSDTSLEFQLDRMTKLNLDLGVSTEAAKKLKEKYGIWSGRESKDFQEGKITRRSGVPAFVVLDTEGGELKYLNTEAETIQAMADWPLDDPKGVF
jgi:thiol-disulfide isomerase/thioredoxin